MKFSRSGPTNSPFDQSPDVLVEDGCPPRSPSSASATPFGLAEQILNLKAGAHLCLFYDQDPAEQMPALVPFIQQALSQNEQFIYVVDDQTVAEFSSRLEEHGIDVHAETSRRRLRLWTRAEWRQEGPLRSERKAQQVRRCILEAQRSGFSGIRFGVEMTWTLDPDIDAADLEHWEATINTLFDSAFPGKIICQYNCNRLSPEVLLAALHTHPLVILDQCLSPNLFYRAPLILDRDQGAAVPVHRGATAAEEVEWMFSQLRRARSTEREREELIQQQAAFFESEAAQVRVENILEGITDGFVALDESGRCRFANKAAQKMIGRPADTLVGSHWNEFAILRGARLEQELTRASRDRVAVECEQFSAAANRWLEIRAFPASTGGLCISLRDVTERKRSEEALVSARRQLETQVEDLRRLHEMSVRLSTSTELETMLVEILHAALAVHHTDMGLLSLCDPDCAGLRIGVSSGLSEDFLKRLRVVLPGAGACGTAFQKRQRVVVEDVAIDPIFAGYREAAELAGFRAVHSTPLITHNDKIVGVLSVHFRKTHRPSAREIYLVDLYARQAADAIESARLRADAQRELAERERAESDIRKSEEQLRRLVSVMPTAVYACDEDGRVTFFNRKAAEIWGREPRTGGDAEKFGGAVRVLRADGSPLAREELPVALAIRFGQSVRNQELVIERADGSRVTVSVNVDPMLDASGRRCGAINVFQDITRQKQAEEALRTSEHRLRLAVDLTRLSVYDWEPATGALNWDARLKAMWGLPADAYVDYDVFLKGLHPDDRASVEAAIARTVDPAGDGIYEAEFRVIGINDHVERWVAARGQTFFKDGRPSGYIGGALDITERKRAEERLEKAVAERTAELRETNSQLEDFVYTIAHDVRAPLRSMQAFSSLLLEEYSPTLDATAQDYARRIVRSAESMDAMVLDLLAYGRVARSEMALNTVDVRAAWDAAIAQNEQAITEKRASVLAVLPLHSIRAHETTFIQVLANLLSNALKFVAPGATPQVRISSQSVGDRVHVTVEDNGIGIAPEHQERIFRIFERLHGKTYGGTGIGLSIVRKGVERMGGRITLDSAPNHGTRFHLDLPAAPKTE
jgi:PAS domain S-box-containing protein